MIVRRIRPAKSPAVFVVFRFSLSLAHYCLHTSRAFHSTARGKKSELSYMIEGWKISKMKSPYWLGGDRQTGLSHLSCGCQLSFTSLDFSVWKHSHKAQPEMTPKRTYCCKCRGKTYAVSAELLLALSGLHREHWCDNFRLPVKKQTK